MKEEIPERPAECPACALPMEGHDDKKCGELWAHWAMQKMGFINSDDSIHINSNDPVHRPAHYTQGKIEVMDFILDQKLGWAEGNVVKYVCRAPFKGKQIEDLKKAMECLRRRIEFLEKEGA